MYPMWNVADAVVAESSRPAWPLATAPATSGAISWTMRATALTIRVSVMTLEPDGWAVTTLGFDDDETGGIGNDTGESAGHLDGAAHSSVRTAPQKGAGRGRWGERGLVRGRDANGERLGNDVGPRQQKEGERNGHDSHS